MPVAGPEGGKKWAEKVFRKGGVSVEEDLPPLRIPTRPGTPRIILGILNGFPNGAERIARPSLGPAVIRPCPG